MAATTTGYSTVRDAFTTSSTDDESRATDYTIDTSVGLEYTTKSNVLPVPVLNTTDDLIIFTSVICGVLGVILVLAIIGWITDQFNDPVKECLSKKIDEIIKQTKEIGPISTFPRVHLSLDNNIDAPSWLKQRDQKRNSNPNPNPTYEELDVSKAQYETAVQINQMVSEGIEEFSDDDYEDCKLSPASQQRHDQERDIKPSAVKEYERRKTRIKRNVYDNQIIADENPRHITTPSAQGQRLQVPTYETNLHGSADSAQYGGSLYSNIEAPPGIPPRNRSDDRLI